MALLNGIDVSNHQKGIRLAGLPRLDLTIFKASQGSRYPDPYFEGFMEQAEQLAIPRTGGYWWVETHEPLIPQLDVYLRKIERYVGRPGFRLFADWEPRNPERVEVAAEAIDRLKTKTGAQPHIYMNRGTAHRYPWQPVRDLGAQLWLAQYAHTRAVHGFADKPWHEVPAGWETTLAGLQYTDQGRLPGWGSGLDLNRFWWWPPDGMTAVAPAMPTLPVIETPPIPVLRESDPPVELRDAEGRTFRGCVCMKLIMPLYDAKLREAGLVTRGGDVMQGGYSTRVAQSAQTHHGGGVWDMRPLRNDRQAVEIGQRLGIVVFIRRWPGNEHYHCLILGCPHQHQQAEDQLSDRRIGYLSGMDGLANPGRFVGPRGLEPRGGWQEAYRAATAVIATILQEEDMPDFNRTALEFEHHGVTNADDPETGWQLPPDKATVVGARDRRLKIDAHAIIHVPADVRLVTRWVSWSGRPDPGWVRGPRREHANSQAETVVKIEQAWAGADLRLDVWCDKPCKVYVEQTAWVWEL